MLNRKNGILFHLFFTLSCDPAPPPIPLVCVLGEPMSRPCPRTPEPFRTPGPDRKTNTSRQRDLSAIQQQITHTNTLLKASHARTSESAPVDTWRWKIYLNECSPQKKMRTGKCVRTEIRYENAYRGGRNSFDLMRMVEKNKTMADSEKIKGVGGGALNNSKRNDGDNWFWSAKGGGGRDGDGGEARKEVMEMEQEWQQK